MRPTHLSFYLDHEAYALPLAQVHEIIGLSPLEQQPGDFMSLRGVMELHGSLIPVVDLREPHGVPAPLHGRFMVAIVVKAAGVPAGLLVDGIGEVFAVLNAELMAPLAGFSAVVERQFVLGLWQVAGKTVTLVDAEQAVSEALRSQRGGADSEA